MMKSKRSSRAVIFPFLLAVLLLSLSVAVQAQEVRPQISADDGVRLAEAFRKERRVAFYAIGAGEAMLLDAANPRCQQRYFTEKFSLEKFFNPAGS